MHELSKVREQVQSREPALNTHNLPYSIASCSVFPSEVYDIRLHLGGDFRPPHGGGNLRLHQGASSLRLCLGGGGKNFLSLLGLHGSLSLLPALAGVAPLLFRFGSRFEESPM